MRVGNKLLLLSLIVSILPVSVVSYLNYISVKTDLKQKIYNELTSIIVAKKEHIEQLIKLRQEQVLIIARDHQYHKCLKHLKQLNQKHTAPARLTTEMCKALRDQKKIVEVFSEIFITDADGKIVASTNDADVGRDESGSEVYVNGKKGLYLKDLYFDPETRDRVPCYAIAAPLRSETTNELLGVVSVRIKAILFTNVLKDYAGLGETGETLLVKKMGDEVIFLNNLRHDPDAAFKRKVSVYSHYALPAILSASGQEGIIETKDYRETEVLAAYRHIPVGNWGLVSKIDAGEVFAPLYALRNRALYISISIVLGAALIAYLFGVRIAKSLSTLAIAAKKISSGDLTVTVEDGDQKDEIGMLAGSFSLMTRKLRESYANLEQKVADRTRELEIVNNELREQQKTEIAYNEIVTIINSLAGTEKVLQECLCKIAAFTESQAGVVYLYDEGMRLLRMAAGYAVGNNDCAGIEICELGAGIPGQVALEKRTIVTGNIPDDTIFKIKHGIGESIPKSIGSFPILLQDKVLGVLVLASLRNYSSEMVEFITTATGQLAVAISNLQAYQLIQRQADELQKKGETLAMQNEELQSQSEELQCQTEELRLQQKILEENAREIEAANQAKSEFLANMSHELRTPLTSIIGFSEMLEDQSFGELNAKQKKYVHNIHTSGEHLLCLVNDILDLSKIEAGKMELQYEEFSVNGILKEIETVLKTALGKKGLSFNEEIGERPIVINADKQKFKQIMLNLLSNAIKFTPSGGKIAVTVKLAGELVQISVTDTGIGIKPEYHDRIFEKFQQVDSKSSREYAGTGLGLTLTKKFVELHNGRIWVESELGKGSTFTFTIPVRPDSAALNEKEPLPNKVKSSLILVVGGNPNSGKLLKSYLVQDGHEVVIASTGKEAVRKARELKPAAIILDTVLPDKSGLEVLQELKTAPETKDIVVVVVSVFGEKDCGYYLKAIDYLIKPIDKEGMLRTLECHNVAEKQGDKPSHILVIDDEPKTVELIATVLEAKGYRVQRAYGGKEGIDLATRNDYNLIILDLMMPVVDGFDVVEELQKHPRSKDVPLIISTAMDLSQKDILRLRGKVESIAQKGKFSKEDLLRYIRRIENKG